jgi:hypothetical protein
MKRDNPGGKESFYRLTPFDVVLIVLILFASTGVILFTELGLNWQLSETPEAVVYHEGKLLEHLSLDKDREIVLLKGKMILEIKDERVRVKKSDCPRQICVSRGWIKRPGQVIVCVPNKILIEIKKPVAPLLDAVVS